MIFLSVHCFRVSIPPAARPTLLRRMDMGSLTCAQIWVRAVNAKWCVCVCAWGEGGVGVGGKGEQAQTSLHKSSPEETKKLCQSGPAEPPGDGTQDLLSLSVCLSVSLSHLSPFFGSSDLNSDALNYYTELCLPAPVPPPLHTHTPSHYRMVTDKNHPN